jgi:hypothetical protein
MQGFNFSTAKVAKFFRKVKKEAIKFLKKFFANNARIQFFYRKGCKVFSQSEKRSY